MRKNEVPFSMAIKNGETPARVFSQILAHGNSSNEIRQETDEDEDGKKRGERMERS